MILFEFPLTLFGIVFIIGCERGVNAMADMMNAREAAFLWGMSDRRVAVLCKSGRIEGAIKQGRNWLIPANTPKPEDRRVKTGAYQKAAPRRKVRCHSLLPLPIGISDYRTA